MDFKQAFDRVWRDALWAKLNKFNINGKCLNVIKNIYENSNSRITTTEGPSAFFPCDIGVRQGDCLSPLLFTIFLNDLQQYLNQHTPGIDFDYIDDEITIYLNYSFYCMLMTPCFLAKVLRNIKTHRMLSKNTAKYGI